MGRRDNLILGQNSVLCVDHSNSLTDKVHLYIYYATQMIKNIDIY